MTRDLPIITQEDQFADYLARGFTMTQIQIAMKLPAGGTSELLKCIREGLGEQAV